jgi:transposase
VRTASVLQVLLGVERTVVERAEFGLDRDGDLALIVYVRPRRGARQRCGRCGRRAGWYDQAGHRRRWRSLDFATTKVWLEAAAPRVNCFEHGPTTVAVPWARHDAGHTLAFDDQVAWLAVHTSRTAVAALMRIAWRTVGAICKRVGADAASRVDRLATLRRIGIDEVSYKKNHHYLTVVVDHDSKLLVWAAPGRDKDTLEKFFDLLGEQGCQQITHVSADGARWIADVVDTRCPNAVRGADPFHVVAWATDALDAVRREVWNTARGGKGKATEQSKALKNARWALWRNEDDLTQAQQAKLEWIQRVHPRLHRAWALKEGLRWVFSLARQGFPRLAMTALDRWLSWARRCRIPEFVQLAGKVARHRDAIEISITHGLNNGLVESTNTKTRLLARQAFGFRDPHALIGLAMLALGGLCPPLPGRADWIPARHEPVRGLRPRAPGPSLEDQP